MVLWFGFFTKTSLQQFTGTRKLNWGWDIITLGDFRNSWYSGTRIFTNVLMNSYEIITSNICISIKNIWYVVPNESQHNTIDPIYWVIFNAKFMVWVFSFCRFAAVQFHNFLNTNLVFLLLNKTFAELWKTVANHSLFSENNSLLNFNRYSQK